MTLPPPLSSGTTRQTDGLRTPTILYISPEVDLEHIEVPLFYTGSMLGSPEKVQKFSNTL